jgi:uncharacterized protein YqgC (DUF456 family)
MNKSPVNAHAGGGALIALGAIGGAIIGLYSGQASAGLIVGTGLGAAVALLMWWRSR